MSALYQLTNELKELEALALSSDVEDQTMLQAINDTLDGLQMEFNDKAVAVVQFAEGLAGDVSIIDQEIKRLTERKKAIQKRETQIKDYLRHNMEQSGVKKIECSLFSITLAKGRQTVQITDESAIPNDYLTIKTEIKPNKAAIAKAIKSGQSIEGAQMVEGQPSLRIK